MLKKFIRKVTKKRKLHGGNSFSSVKRYPQSETPQKMRQTQEHAKKSDRAQAHLSSRPGACPCWLEGAWSRRQNQPRR